MGKPKKSLLFAAALAMLASACATGARVTGPVSNNLPRKIHDTDFYEIGDPSLPSARKFAKDRADAFRAISDDESSFRSAATATTFGTLLSALGLSLTGGGSTDAFAILGLTGATAGGAERLYTSRLRQGMLEDGTGAIRCLLASTEPYLIYQSEGEELFGAGFGGGYSSSGGAAGGAIGPITKRELARILAASEAAGALSGVEKADILGRAAIAAGDVNLRAILTASSAANILQPAARNDILRRARTLAQGVHDDGLDERLTAAVLEAEDAKALLDQAIAALAAENSQEAASAALQRAVSAISDGEEALAGLSIFKQGVRKSGTQLESHVEDVISALRIEFIKREPNPETATKAFADAKTSLAAFFAGVKVDDATLKSLGALTGGKAGVGAGADGIGAATAGVVEDETVDQRIVRELLLRLDRLNHAVAVLRQETAKAERILRDFENRKTDAGKIAECPVPTVTDTLIVSPSARQLTLAPGKTLKLTIIAGSKPAVTETSDASGVLTVEDLDESGSANKRYEVTLKAAATVAKISTAEVEIALTDAGVKRIKTITITAGTAATAATSVTVTPPDKSIELVRGGPTKTLVVKTGDGKKPKIEIEDLVEGEDFLTKSINEKPGAQNTFDVEIGIKPETPDSKEVYDIKITSNDGRTKVDRKITITGASAPDFKSMKPNDFEKVKQLVTLVQEFLNSSGKPDDAKDLKITGEMDEATRKSLWAYQERTADVKVSSGKLDDETVENIRNALIAKNIDEIKKSDSVTAAQIKKAENALFGRMPGMITKNGELSLEERRAIWVLQLSLIMNGHASAGAIKITGALDQATYAALTGSGG